MTEGLYELSKVCHHPNHTHVMFEWDDEYQCEKYEVSNHLHNEINSIRKKMMGTPKTKGWIDPDTGLHCLAVLFKHKHAYKPLAIALNEKLKELHDLGNNIINGVQY